MALFRGLLPSYDGHPRLAQPRSGYHTLSPDQAIERILESKGLDPRQDITSRGVAELRRIRRSGRYDYSFEKLPEGLLE